MTTLSYESVVAPPSSGLPRVGYENFFRTGSVSVSSEDTNFPLELAFDGFTYDGLRFGTDESDEWIKVQVASSPADYMAIAAHTLEGCTLTPQRSANDVAWTNLAAPFVAQSNRPIVWEWDLVSAPYWRLLIQDPPSSQVISLGAIHVGAKLTLPYGFKSGWKPPSLNEEVEFSNTISEGGQLIGRSVIRRGVSVDVKNENVLYTLARDDWQAMIDVAETYPVFFWRVMQSQAEIVYGGMVSRSVEFVRRGKYVNVMLSVAGISR